MSISAPCFWKNKFLYSKKSEIKYSYTYDHIKGTAEILEENTLYFKLYKKDIFWQKSIHIRSQKFVDFL
jgi:predicted nuclease of restriction endonuclease-like RecB superfamily